MIGSAVSDLPFLMLALISVLLTACSQLLLKAGVKGAMSSLPDGASLASVGVHFASNPLLWCGVGTMAVSLLSWMGALSRLEVSRAYPLTALGIVLTVVAGRFLLGETLSGTRIAGSLLIVGGMILVARS